MSNNYNELLKDKIKHLGYRVEPTSTTSNKSCHSPDFVVFIRNDVKSIEQTYSIAHELGHCVDFKRGTFDFQRYRMNSVYRFRKEVVAWYLAFIVCHKMKIPIKLRFASHSWHCLKSYLKISKEEVISSVKCSFGLHNYTNGCRTFFEPVSHHCDRCWKTK